MKILNHLSSRAQRWVHALLATVLTLAPASTPALRQAALVAGSAAAAGVLAVARTPALDPILGAPSLALAYDPNLPPGAIQSDYCYGLNDNGAMVDVVNRFNGTSAYTSTVTGLQGGTNEASSFDPSDATFYILDQYTRPDRLVKITLAAGGSTSATEVGTGGLLTVTNPFTLAFGVVGTGNEDSGNNRVTGITLNPFNGKMYGVTDENYLFQIDKTTGKVVLGAMAGNTDFVQVSLTNTLEIEDMAFDPMTGKLYVVFENPRDGNYGYIQEIDLSSGALIGSPMGPIGNAGAGSTTQPGPGGQAETEGLTFGGDGTLYVSLGDAGLPSNDGRLIAIKQPINDANVEAGIMITKLAFATDLRGGSSNYDYESVSCNAAASIALAIQKTHTPPNNLTLGQQVVFQIVVTNTGVFTSNAQLVDAVPSDIGVTAWSCSISDPNEVCTPSSGDTNNIAVTGFIPPITGTMNLVITGVVRALAGDITNTAQVTNTGNIPEDSTNNVATDTVKIATPGVIGNYVWLDENGDGQQDAGEAGIANVVVQAVNAAGVTLTTTTDANGGYLFNNLPAGTYTVSVQGGSLPAGLVQTTNPVNGGADFGNQTQPYVVNLAAGQENLTADFGYNYAPSGDTGTPAAGVPGAIGDRVWIDANGDGRQDPGEPGIGGVTVNLLVDTNKDGIYGGPGDVPAVSTVTKPDGTYIFDDLPAGGYVVSIPNPPAGYTQTGDPDHFGTTGANNDNKTTLPVVLGPGDVFVNADFGYQPPAGADFDIGDTIFLDANGNGTGDSSDYGIAGVTVKLLDSAGNVIASTTTDASGNYLFTGLPDGTYTVKVVDADNVLGLLTQTSTPNNTVNDGQPCGVCNGQNTLTLSGASNLNQDFGYAPVDHGSVDGLIGDTVFHDRNNNSMPDPGEGLEGVQVTLTYPNGVTLTTTTNENGHYYFGNLPAGAYTVTVNTGDLPPALQNTVDPDGGADSKSIVNLPAGGINLAQDFGYRTSANPGAIGDLVWNDTNADGVKDASEAGISGVTIDLYLDVNGNGRVDPGEPLFGSTVTDASGAYLFDNLPTSQDGVKYIVDVTDEAGVLGGYWHSLGAANTNDNSQVDPLAVTLTTQAPNYTAADFGYYVLPGAAGNFVWQDTNGNGVQEPGEPGLDGITVTLTITYPNDDVSTLATRSGDDPSTSVVETGWYSFGNLLLDEDYRQSSGTSAPATNQPAYSISVATPPGYVPSPTGNGTPMTDSNDNGGTAVAVTKGQNGVAQNVDPASEANPIAGYDFGFFVPASIGDTVFYDVNGDGVQDPGDLPLIGVVLELKGDIDGDNIIDTLTTTTSFTGYYQFGGLPAGQYTVTVDVSSLPPGVTPTYDKDGGTISPDGVTPVTLGAGDSIQDVDFGYTGDLSLGDYVWNDVNADGVQDAWELPLPGVVLTLTGDLNADNILDTLTTTTNAGGGYWFSHLPAGTFTVTVDTATLPAGLDNPTYDLDSGTVSPDSQAVVTLTGAPNFDVDFGYRAQGAIGDYVWHDANGDGVQDASETPLAGVVLVLTGDLNGDGTADTLTTTTSVTGYYQFSGLPAGAFTITVDATTLPPGMSPTAGPQSAGSNQSVVSLAPSESRQDVDFGYRGTGAIGDYVWNDANNDGIQDAGELPLPGVVLTLVGDVNGDGVADTLTTTTSVTGYYQFPGLPAGTFTVTVDATTLPPDMTPTSGPQSVGSNQSVVNLSPNESRQTIDFGYRQLFPELVLTKVGASNGVATMGSLITYTLRVTNTGEATATGVQLSESVPAGTAFVSASAGVTPDAGGMLTWTVGSLTVNQTYVATMIVRVTSVSQAIVNVARVGSTTLPPTDSNRVVIPVQPTAVTLASFNVATASRGMQVTWRTALERNTFGFYVLRSATGNRADAVQVNAEMVVAAGPNTYSLLDESGSAGNAYWLQEVELDGTRHDYGPVIAQAPLPGAAASQPNPQPVMPAPVAGVPGGGVIVPNTGSVPAPQPQMQPAAPEPAVIAAAPAVIAPEAQSQPAAQAGAEQSASQPQPVPPAQAAIEPAAQAMAQPAPEALPMPAAKPVEQVLVGAQTGIDVARGGQPASAQLPTTATQETVAAAQTTPMNPLAPLGAAVLALLGLGAAGVFVARRRRMK